MRVKTAEAAQGSRARCRGAYFPTSKASGREAACDPATDWWLERSDDRRAVLHFTLPLKAPASAAKIFTLLVYDPTYSLAFGFDDRDPVTLGGAPGGCSVSVSRPRPLDATESRRLSEATMFNASPGADFALRMAQRAIVACP